MDNNTLHINSNFFINSYPRFIKLFIIFLLFAPFELSIAQENKPELIESFIAFQTSKKSGDKFYRIMVDDFECPYLDLENILKDHLGLTPKIDVSKITCSVDIVIEKSVFRIDGIKGEYEIKSSKKNIKQSFKKAQIIVHEGKLWIQYVLLTQWLPVKINWELDRYYMRFIPQFPLIKEIIKNRERTRRTDRENVLNRKKINNIKAIKPSGNFNTELRLKLNNSYTDNNSIDDRSISYFAYDLNSDIYEGTFKINGLYTKATGSDPESSVRWKYKREEQKYFHLFEAGNIFNTTTALLNPTVIVKNGINIKRLPKIEGISGFNFEGYTQPGTEIDIYVNGFLSESLKTIDGKYEINNFKASGGEVVILKFYFSDGSSKIKMYQISSDGGKLIPEGSWDYQLFTGQEDDDDKEERYGFINLKYGIFDNLSMGLHSYTYPETDVSGLEFVWKPVVGLYLTSEHMFSEGTMGNAFAIEGTYLPSSFRFETRFIDENSPIIDIQSSEKKYPEYSFLRYSINSAGWYLRCQYTDSTDHMKYESIIKKKVMRNLTLSTENSLKTFKDNTTDDFKSNIIIAEIMLRKHNIRLSWNIDTYQSLSYRYQPGRDAKYYWSASYNRYETNNEYDAFLSFTYKFGDFLTTQISLSDDYRKIENSLEGIISGSKGPEKSDQYAMGTLYGVVKTPGDDKSPSIAIEGATVMAGSRRAVTDKNGNYIIHGLPVDQRVVFSVLPSTLDVGLTPKQEFNVFKFRPGTIIEYNPIFQKTVGIDGVILFDGTIPAGAEIYAHHIETDRVVATGEIDPDGFFVIEGIIPGLYNFEIKGIRKDDAVFEYLVKGDEDWISELKLKVKTH